MIQFLEESEEIGTSQYIDDAEAKELAAEAIKVRAERVRLDAEEERLKKLLAMKGYNEFLKALEKNEYTGCFKIVPSEDTPIRVDMRLKKGTMKETMEPELNRIFGDSYSDFFVSSHEVQKILSADDLIEKIRASGKNPWNYLTLEVREGKEKEVLDLGGKSVIGRRVINPIKGFFGVCQEYGYRITKTVKKFLGEYLPAAVEPCVILGTRGKKL